MKLTPVLLLVLLLVLPCTAQEPSTLDLDSAEGLIIDSPGGYAQAAHSFGSVPVRDGEPTQGLTVTLNTGDGIVFYGPAIETGPGEVLVECTVWCTGPDVGLALVAMNLPDYSMMANLPASGEKYTGGWRTMRLIYDPRDDTLMLGFQSVSTGDASTTVYVDEIIVTPIGDLDPGQVLEMFGLGMEPTPIPTSTPISGLEEITVNIPGLPEGAKPLEMVLIPAGTFTMGSPEDERGRSSDEEQHAVTLTQAFYLGKYEVTQAQWEAVMGSNPASSYPASNHGVGNDHPAHTVSWNDCQTFIETLNGMGLGTFRLPTEAEWEYACRAGTDTRFSFGDALECANESDSYCAIMDEYMWWRGNRTYGGEQGGSKEVGRKLPNPWGLHDMHGNLYEWCSDWYGSYPSGPKIDPQGPSMGSYRVIRGGAWIYYARDCRSADRLSDSPDIRPGTFGLRLLRSYEGSGTGPTPTDVPAVTPTVTPTSVNVPITELQIVDVDANYRSPYMVEFNFSLKDQDDHSVVAHPSTFEITCMEDGDTISPSETGAYLWSTANKQLKCMLVLDYTGSMADISNGDSNNDGKSDAIEAMESAAKAFVDSLDADAQVGVYEFHREDRDPQKVIDFSANKAALKAAIDSIWMDYVQFFWGGSRVWDGLYAAIEEFEDGDQGDEQRFVVFLSDGQDESSTYRTSNVISAAQSKEVRLYSIGFGAELDADTLTSLVSQASGEYYRANTVDEVTEQFQQIIHDLGGRYTIRWLTLRRSSSVFRPSFEVQYGDVLDTYTEEANYWPPVYVGDVVVGSLRVESVQIGEDEGLVTLRADYVPRLVRRLRLFVRTQYAYEVSLVPESEGGLCEDWSILPPEEDAENEGVWIELQSSNPNNPFTSVPYGAFGKILQFHVTEIADPAEFLFGENEAVGVDNSIYENTGGQSFLLQKGRPTVGDAIAITLPGLPEDAKHLEMVYIPADTFTMGSELGWPPHDVALTQGFYLGKYEVTQAQWVAVMGNNPSTNSSVTQIFGIYGVGDDYPVYYVSWDDCQSFIEQLNGMGLGTFRLPTEAEWEYACRAGTTTLFSFGDALECSSEILYCDVVDEYAWYLGNNMYSGNMSGPKEVGRKLPNPWGLHNMHGNVFELCSDWWERSYARGPQIDPQGPTSGPYRVARGGYWNGHFQDCRSTTRRGATSSPTNRNSSALGLRLLKSYEGSETRATPTDTPTPTPTLTPTGGGDAITINLPGLPSGAKRLEMVLIDPGAFTMGTPENEPGRRPPEMSQYTVVLTQGFYLGKYEVTQAQWVAVMGNNPSGFGGKPDHPVEQVSWNDCQPFIERLNGMGLGTFRLPTEAEWEYACRAGTQTRFSFGDALECADEGEVYCELADQYMWWGGNDTYGDNVSGSKEVGRKLPNPWGLYDMHGNVTEWCSDWWGGGLSNFGHQIDPQGPTSGSDRVARGGRWGFYAQYCRSADRGRNYSSNLRSHDIGLRLVREYP